jgi:peptide/nickel transport system ATP-binding protein
MDTKQQLKLGETLVETKNLSIDFAIKSGFFKKSLVQAVTDVSLKIKKGETFGVVGESGCGKTTLGNLILGLLEPTAGSVFFKGQDINAAGKRRLKEIRKDMQMIFQDPFSSLNSRFDVLKIISEPLVIRKWGTPEQIKNRIIDLLKLVGLDEKDLYRHPSDFSGGQRQRIGIARAIALNPEFLVCDEPVSALDVSVHAQILNLLMDLQKELGLTYLLISHNLAVVKHVSNTMCVMYLGRVVETGATELLFNNPRHPYTQALLSSVLDMDVEADSKRVILQGDIPSPINPPIGCRFCKRCALVANSDTEEKNGIKQEYCQNTPLELTEIEPNHLVACHFVNRAKLK